MANGIPDLLNKISAITNPVALLGADASRILGFFAPPQWGIYRDGELAIEPDSIIAIDYKAESRITDYPQEAGAFQAYNKVATPQDVRVRMTKGGTDNDRTAFLTAIKDASDSLNLYDVMMPEFSYSNCNIFHVDFRRTAQNGVGLLTVDLWLLEIRTPTSETAFSNTKEPAGRSPFSLGSVLPQVPTVAQVSAVAKAKAKSIVKNIIN